MAFALLFGGAILGAPLLLLHGSTQQTTAAARSSRHGSGAGAAASRDPSQLVGYRADSTVPDMRLATVPATTTTAPPPSTTTTTAPPPSTTSTTAAPPPTTTTTAPPPSTTTTAAPVATAAPAHSATGQATWYAQSPPGGCASPTLPFGTSLEVTDLANGATTTCVVDDREAPNPGRVLDMSYSGFSQLADPSQGVITVTISW